MATTKKCDRHFHDNAGLIITVLEAVYVTDDGR